MKYQVTVERKGYLTGVVEVSACSPEDAELKVQKQIRNGTLQVSDVAWGGFQEEDGEHFYTTGDIE